MDFSNLLFLPIDVPKVPLRLEEIQAFGQVQPGDQTFSDRFCKTVMLRNAVNADVKSIYKFYDSNLVWEWTDLARQHFPMLIEFIETHMPFQLLTLVTFVAPKLVRDVPPHRDFPPHLVPDFVRQNEPYAYRLSFGNTHNKFYLCDREGLTESELNEGKYIFGNFPETTDAWVMNTTACCHNTLSVPDKETLFICGILDPDRHRSLLQRSLTRYNSHAVMLKDLETHGRPLREVVNSPWTRLYERHPELTGQEL